MHFAEYEQANRLLERLLATYEGVPLEEAIPGQEVSNAHGTCYLIESSEPFQLPRIPASEAEERILGCMHVLRGIGEKTEEVLRDRGNSNIPDLRDHPRFGKEAQQFLATLEEGSTSEILAWIGRKLPKSHGLALLVSCLEEVDKFVFVDIETLGLGGVPLFLIGLGELKENKLVTYLYLARSLEEERAALHMTLKHVGDSTAFVSFNGINFDVPYITQRLAHHGHFVDLGRSHYDALLFARRAWRDRLPNCRLTTIEQHKLSLTRQDDVPSAYIPAFYKTYLRRSNVGPLVPIVEHNRIDVLSTARIFSLLISELSGSDF